MLKITGALESGYVITPTAFAGNGGSATNLDNASGGYYTDSNFKYTNGAYYSEHFYLKPGGDDLSKDIGVCRVRDLEIVKSGTDLRPLAGVEFTIYGPFDGLTGLTLTSENEFATIETGADGKAVFTSSVSKFLNYYQNYVVVETTAKTHYDPFQSGRGGWNHWLGD